MLLMPVFFACGVSFGAGVMFFAQGNYFQGTVGVIAGVVGLVCLLMRVLKKDAGKTSL